MTDDFLAAIGAVTVQFAVLENHLEMAIWTLLVGTNMSDQPTGRIVTSELSFQKSVHLFAALHRHRFPGEREEQLKSLCKKLRQIEDERNVIAHSTWLAGEEGKIVRFKSTAKGVLKAKFEHLSLADTKAIATRIHSAAEDVFNFLMDILEPSGHPRYTI